MVFQGLEAISTSRSTCTESPFGIDLQQFVYYIFGGVIKIWIGRELKFSIQNHIKSSCLTASVKRYLADVHPVDDAAEGPQVWCR